MSRPYDESGSPRPQYAELVAVEAFAADVYGERRVSEAGVLTREEVEASPHYEPAMRGVSARRWISFTGLDVVRCEDGRFRVIED